MYKIKNQIEKDSFVIIRISDGNSFVSDPSNTDYQEYLAWVADGGVPEPVDTPEEAE